jgi:hypothetical protein
MTSAVAYAASWNREREPRMSQRKDSHEKSAERFVKTEIHTLIGANLILIEMVYKPVEEEKASHKTLQQKDAG